MAADHDLLFGLLALRNGLIDEVQFMSAFQARTKAECRPPSDHLVKRGELSEEGRVALDAMVSLHLGKHGEGAGHDSASMTPDFSSIRRLASLDDPEITASLARFHSAPTQANDDHTPHFPDVAEAGQRFRVLRPHAQGGLGAVFVAVDKELNREVAFKQILDVYADDPTSRARFLQEAEITGGLEHPGIVPVYGLGTCGDGRLYYAMRLIRGDTLKEAISRHHGDPTTAGPGRGPLGLRKLLRRFIDACNAIEYAHSRGVLHRDIKPANVIVGEHGETLVIDWGLAKAVCRAKAEEFLDEQTLAPSSPSGSSRTLPGSALGTPAYMSPEQAAGKLDSLGPRCDVYSLGATLYCILTGRAPFEGNDLAETLRHVSLGRFIAPRAARPDLPAPLDAVCRKAMALHASDRYGSPRALADDIELWLAGEPTGAWPEPLWTRSARWARRHRPIVAMSMAILATSTVALAIGTRLIAIERNGAMRERNEAWHQKREAQVERDRAKDFSLQAERKEFQLRDVYAGHLLDLHEPKPAFMMALRGLNSREDLIRLHPSNGQLEEDRVDSLILCARIMATMDAESLQWVVERIGRQGDAYPKTPKLALVRARDACVELARANSSDAWRKLWCIERLMTTAKLQRDLGDAGDSLESFLLCHDSYAAIDPGSPTIIRAASYNDACAQAQCIPLLSVLPPSAWRTAEHRRFIEGASIALKRAIEAGFKDFAHIRSDADLNPLRSRREFRDIIDDLVFPPDPFAR